MPTACGIFGGGLSKPFTEAKVELDPRQPVFEKQIGKHISGEMYDTGRGIDRASATSAGKTRVARVTATGRGGRHTCFARDHCRTQRGALSVSRRF